MPIYRVIDNNNTVTIHRCNTYTDAMNVHMNHLSLNNNNDKIITQLHADLTDEKYCKKKACRNFIKTLGPL